MKSNCFSCFATTLIFTIILLSTPVVSNSAPENPYEVDAKSRYDAKDVREDFLVPTSPAFTVLGATPEEVVRPDSPRALATALLNGVDANGNMQTGIALDFAPFYLFSWRDLQLSEYRNDPLKRMLSRLQFSLATVKGSDDDKSAKLSAGLRLALLDTADPRMSIELDSKYEKFTSQKSDELKDARKNAASLLGPIQQKKSEIEELKANLNFEADKQKLKELNLSLTTYEESRAAALQKVNKLISEAEKELLDLWTKANEEFEKEFWNATNLTVGIAPIFYSEEGNVEDLDSSGYSAYVSFAYGFEQFNSLKNNSQLILHARYRTKEQVENPDQEGDLIEQDVFLIGVQLRIVPEIGNGKIGFFGEYDYRSIDREETYDDNSYRYAIGVDYKMVKNTTLSLIVGEDSGDDVASSGLFTFGGLKWAF